MTNRIIHYRPNDRPSAICGKILVACTSDKKEVTCKRCRGILKPKRKHKNSPRFNWESREKIRGLYLEGYATSYLARKYKCNINAIWNVVFDLQIPYRPESYLKAYKKTARLTEAQVKKIRHLAIDKNVGNNELATKFNVSGSTILSVVKGRTYRWVPGKIRPRMGELRYIEPLSGRAPQTKSDRKSGPNENTVRLADHGECLKLAKINKVSPSAISRWLRKCPERIKRK